VSLDKRQQKQIEMNGAQVPIQRLEVDAANLFKKQQ